MHISKSWHKAFAIILLGAVLVALAASLFIYFGIYNVRATREPPAPIYHLLHTVMRRSDFVRADDIPTPDLKEPGRIRNGFILFREHCVQCHGAAGVTPQPFALGLRPLPPSLLPPAKEWTPAQLYWVIKYGVSFTAMPAWEFRLKERELWDVTAFVKYLPRMSPTEYRQWDKELPHLPDAPAQSGAIAARLGDPAAGKHAINQYLCATCHKIPGIVGATKMVGPPLGGIARRAYIAGKLKNTPDNMLRWLADPQKINPDTAMPNLHIREQDIQDIAAYLYTLDEEK